ncbi:hypothetical protein BGW36DRAFT_366746 [Talaromyces proteolyticus]|uniref:Major facilitator superfamily (MFS) profile domain-containing protein n=1 Tax=Talaromyces proteolyticus TaxID=1131652 RepID=A0AAD4L4U1_9EURO|nr:uncharacterized protein BGW36DRAFT_366746 [Talaromyces proteolyticus]KAH8705061.1 hypothetical protein BGW36DRAFT_366746 [Talaromyces proteolyticus]
MPVFDLCRSSLLCNAFSIFLFGRTIQYSHQVHIAVPIVSIFISGWTAISTQSLIATYLVDVFPDTSAAASASLNLARCLFAAGGDELHCAHDQWRRGWSGIHYLCCCPACGIDRSFGSVEICSWMEEKGEGGGCAKSTRKE